VAAIPRNGTIELVSTTGAINWSTRAVGGGTCVSVARTGDIEYRTGDIEYRTGDIEYRTGESRDGTDQLAAATGMSFDDADAPRAFANDVPVSTNRDQWRADEVRWWSPHPSAPVAALLPARFVASRYFLGTTDARLRHDHAAPKAAWHKNATTVGLSAGSAASALPLPTSRSGPPRRNRRPNVIVATAKPRADP
jgi:hypothetical protein